MDFSTRSSNQQSPAAPRPGTTFAGGETPAGRKQDSKGGKRLAGSKWAKWGGLLLLVAVAVLVLAVIWILINGNAKKESSYIDSSKLQAVFLTNDQVYFGHITALNGKYLTLSNIYYLQTQNSGSSTQTTTANNVSLVKLGCELHKPYDQMVINASEVQFWENLQSDGQVANAVKQFQTNNPNGQKCSNTAANGASSSTVQGGAATPTTNNTTSTTKKQ